MTTFVDTLTGLNKDPLLTQTENGPSVVGLINHLQKNVDTWEARDFIVTVLSRLSLEACIRAGDRCRLPSAKAGRMWSAFHCLRVDAGLRATWSNFLLGIKLPASLNAHSLLALQFVIDRLLKKLIAMKSDKRGKETAKRCLSTLTLREQNAVYYMSGHIPVKLIPRFKK